MPRALAVACDDEGAALVLMRHVVIEGGHHIAIGERERLIGIFPPPGEKGTELRWNGEVFE